MLQDKDLNPKWIAVIFLVVAALVLCALTFSATNLTTATLVFTFLLALIPVPIVLASSSDDADEGSGPLWATPPLIGTYVLSVMVLAAAYMRRSSLPDVAIVASGAAAAALVGGLFGFIFAIPRSLQQQSGSQGGGNDQFYAPNTNLEQISDWLTKILVGISLVQYRALIDEFNTAVGWMAKSLGEPDNAFFSGAILLAYAVAGFFCTYIWTRLRFTRDLTSLERNVGDSPEYVEGLANAYLYQPAPAGYTKSLGLTERYLKRFGTNNDRIWLYVACGCGQKYRDLSLQIGESPTPEQAAELERIEKQAIAALQQVMDLAPRQYQIAHALWDPSDSSDDGDDLRAFYKRPKFVELFKKWDPAQSPGTAAAEVATVARVAAAAAAAAHTAAAEQVAVATQATGTAGEVATPADTPRRQ